MAKRKTKVDTISDNLGNNTKKTELEKAKEVLNKAKKLNAPVTYLKSSDSSFGRALEEKRKEND